MTINADVHIREGDGPSVHHHDAVPCATVWTAPIDSEAHGRINLFASPGDLATIALGILDNDDVHAALTPVDLSLLAVIVRYKACPECGHPPVRHRTTAETSLGCSVGGMVDTAKMCGCLRIANYTTQTFDVAPVAGAAGK
jgi:hypothetical protein